MLEGQETQWFECLKAFDHLNGREKQHIAVGDSADARTARFLFLAHVKHNWPSQWRTRYKDGYIEFEENRKKFDRQKQTIRGKPVFLFIVTPEIYILWRRQTLEDKIKHSMNEMSADDRLAAAHLVRELAGSKDGNQAIRRPPLHAHLLALSVSELEGLAGLFEMPSGRLAVASPTAA